ncbi:MAG: type VI secretion system baseplate subunit TssE [Gemmataceae bacterium]
MDDYPPSFLNRLTDPDIPDKRCHYSLAQTEQSVMRDLEDLLNTKRPRDGIFSGCTEVEHSIANFGLRDVTHVKAQSPDERQRFAEHVRDVIVAYEPRLKNVDVSVRQPDDVKAELPQGFKLGAIFLRIRATLNVDPMPVDGIVFDTVLHLASGHHDVLLPGATV